MEADRAIQRQPPAALCLPVPSGLRAPNQPERDAPDPRRRVGRGSRRSRATGQRSPPTPAPGPPLHPSSRDLRHIILRPGSPAASLLPRPAAHPSSRQPRRIPLPGTPGTSFRPGGSPSPTHAEPRGTPSPSGLPFSAPRHAGSPLPPCARCRRGRAGAARCRGGLPCLPPRRGRARRPPPGRAPRRGSSGAWRGWGRGVGGTCAVPSRAAPSRAELCAAEPCPELTATPRARPPRPSPPPPAAPGPCPPPGGHLRRGARRGAPSEPPLSPPRHKRGQSGVAGAVPSPGSGGAGDGGGSAPASSLFERAPAGKASPAARGGDGGAGVPALARAAHPAGAPARASSPLRGVNYRRNGK